VQELALEVGSVDDVEVAAARYMAAGEPSPPAPRSTTLEFRSFFWPALPTSGRMRWRA
jgi:hypothetical protein